MEYKTKKRLQTALRRFYSGKPYGYISAYIGTNRETFINHVNKYLLSGMTRENFGSVWGLDHIVPVDLFDERDMDDLRLCYNFHNIMPMFNTDNRLKGASVHFSLAKLESMHTNVYIQTLIDRCQTEITARYTKYLI